MNGHFVRLDISGSVATTAEAASHAILTAAAGAMRDEASARKSALRKDVLAGLPRGAKLANTWRVSVFPRSGLANDPALQITNNAANIIEAFSAGVIIHAASGDWLAIPSPETLKAYRALTPRGADGTFQDRGAWPQAVAQTLGAKPQFYIERDGRRGFVFVQLGKVRKIIGWLVKQTALGKRIRGTELLQEIVEMLPSAYIDRFNAYLDAELKVAGL